MKKVLISLAVLQSALVASTAFADSTSGEIRFTGRIVNASCIAEPSASRMELSNCRGTPPTVELQKIDKSQNFKVRPGKAYNSFSPEKALKKHDYFTISYATTESLPAKAKLNYLVSYN